MSALTDLGVVEAAALLAGREITATELTAACLHRIRTTDGAHTWQVWRRYLNEMAPLLFK